MTINTPSAAIKPAVLFVCVKNGGKSPMADGLLRHEAGSGITVTSAESWWCWAPKRTFPP